MGVLLSPSRRTWPDRAADVVYALVALQMAVLAIRHGAAMLSLPMFAVAAGFARRAAWASTAVAPSSSAMTALPSLLLGGLLATAAPRVPGWMLLGPCVWTALALVWLGPSFSVLPAVGALVVTGPYRWIRHPAYAGEAVIAGILACFSPWPWTAWPALLIPPALALRVRAEERGLAQLPGWAAYSAAVCWRLVPGVW